MHDRLRRKHGRSTEVMDIVYKSSAEIEAGELHGPEDLIDLLVLGMPTQATDDRDYLFALLSLAKDGEDPAFMPDYTEDFSEVSRSYARHFVESGQGLQMLKQVNAVKTRHNLPSWIPDWSSRQYWNGELPRIGSLKCFERNRDSSEEVLGTKTRSFFAQCHHVDTVISVSDMEYTDDSEEGERRWFQAVDGMTRQASPYPTSQEVEEAKWRAMIGNEVEDEFPAPDNFGARYRLYRMALSQDEEWFADLDPQHYDDATEEKVQQTHTFGLTMGKMNHCRFCITSRGYFGMIPPGVRIDDSIIVIDGDCTTFAVRKLVDKDCYTMLGAIYVHDILLGERDRLQTEISSLIEFQ